MNIRSTDFEYFGDQGRPDHPARLGGRQLLLVWIAMILSSWVLLLGLVGAIVWLL